MKDLLDFKKESRKAIHAGFKKIIRETRGALLSTQHDLDQEDLRGTHFSTLVPKYYSLLDERVNELLKATNRIADDFSLAEHLTHKDFLRDQLGVLFWQAPLHHRALMKPLGYAGDYLMMEMLYDDDPFKGPTSYFKMIQAISCRCISGKFCQERIPYFLQKFHFIGSEAVQHHGNFRMMSLACGSSREIQEFIKSNPVSHSTEVFLVDQDTKAIEHSRHHIEQVKQGAHHKIQTTYYGESLIDLLTNNPLQRFPRFDLIYSGGLFDYIDDQSFKLAVEVLYSMLREGGALVLGNISPDDYSKIIKWYLDDWPLIYRSKQDLLKLVPSGCDSKEIAVEAESTGVNFFLVIKKPQ